MWQMIALVPMHEAGGRLFVDVAPRLASPAGRAALVAMMGRADPLIGDALQTVIDRGLVPLRSDDPPAAPPPGGPAPAPIETDPAIPAGLVARNEASVAAAAPRLEVAAGEAVFDVIESDIGELKRLLAEPESMQVIMAGMEAAWWLNDHLHEWLGEANAADVLTRSVPDNITSEMGLALLEVADVVRAHPDVVAHLERVDTDDVLDGLAEVVGGPAVRDAMATYLDRYGARGVGEIDITRPRWREQPSALLPTLLGHVHHVAPGEGRRRFEQGRQDAAQKEAELLDRLRALPDDGEQKAMEAKRMIDRVRTFAGYREYPKYGIVRRTFLYKQAMVREAERLVDAGVLGTIEDAFFLTFAELREAVRTMQVDDALIRRRADAFASFCALTPPRVLTSGGDAVPGSYRRGGTPGGALVGLAVSAGTVEGRARVITDITQAHDLAPDDILVTAYTDPSWTPLFVAIAGLVTEVGGLMTHGAVIAREYGLPAVVGVQDATRLIRDGQRIRVRGTDGYVELLD
jgi:pyruvate,water dikinase